LEWKTVEKYEAIQEEWAKWYNQWVEKGQLIMGMLSGYSEDDITPL